ncbi:hypothetical protein GW916_00625, partial [bacterium]|nr:hypothetical protein [bacterium]
MSANLQEQSRMIRHAGLELSGTHSAKTCITVLDHYPDSHRLVLSEVHSSMGRETLGNSDEILRLQLNSLGVSPHENFEFAGICTQAPTSLPPHFSEADNASQEVSWLNDYWQKTKPQPRKFLPYLNRPFEIWMRYFTPEKFRMPESMGANLAPIAARMDFIKQELKFPIYENFPRATFQRLNSAIGGQKSWVRDYTDIDKGIPTRERFIQRLLDKSPGIFIYEHDLDILVFELQVFQAFLSALCLYLNQNKQCETRPNNFPQKSTWGLLPRQHIAWE